jgi:hypothetical protein
MKGVLTAGDPRRSYWLDRGEEETRLAMQVLGLHVGGMSTKALPSTGSSIHWFDVP